MGPQLLILSQKQNDIDFWRRIAEREGLLFKNLIEMEEIVRLIREKPDSLILWDGECENLKGLEQVFCDLGVRSRVFVVTDGPARSYPSLFEPPSFNHHLFRRYHGHAEFFCSQLIKKSLEAKGANFDQYFGGDVLTRKTLHLTHSGQKHSAIETFRQLLLQHQVKPRIAEIGSDAVDELLMNAIFDAPQSPDGEYYRRKTQRHEEFALTERETVEAEIAISRDLIGIRVVDQFGSLNTDATIRSLGKNFNQQSYIPSDADPGAGLGISKLMKSALSLGFYVNPGVRTESIALFGNTRSFRKLRQSFCFFSIQSTR